MDTNLKHEFYLSLCEGAEMMLRVLEEEGRSSISPELLHAFCVERSIALGEQFVGAMNKKSQKTKKL